MATVLPVMPSSPESSIHSNSQLLPRRSTLVRKRDDNDEALSLSPTKRSKVTFDSDVEIQMVGDYEKAPELIQEEVRTAFQKRAWGESSGYEHIKAIYSNDADEEDRPSSATLRSYTLALLGNISSLNKSTADLVRIIIKSHWLGRDAEYISIFLRLLANIVTAQGSFLIDVLRMLTENLTATPPSNGRLPDVPHVSRSVIYERAHKSIQYLLKLIPSASSTLRGVLTKAFPHESDSRKHHVIYVQNLLKILSYASELRMDILALITDRLVKIDVQVQIDVEDLEEEIGECLVQGIPQIRPDLIDEWDGDSESSDEDSESDDEDNVDARRIKDIKKDVEKTDAILDILFSYYNQDAFLSKTGSASGAVVEILLSQFTTTILPTYRSRHTQFLLFHFVQQSSIYIDLFVGTCVHKVFDKKQPAVIRQNAAAYLASFVARGIHVPSNIVRDVFDYISTELDRSRRAFESTCRGPDLRRYTSYYYLVQALLYIFCFRWRELQVREDDDEDNDDDDLEALPYQSHQWKPGVKEAFSSNIFSKLNPLKVCSPAIVSEFARVAKHLGLLYVYHLLETNKRIHLTQYARESDAGMTYGQVDRETALSISQDESHQHLDAYFPFDPYHLPKSKRWLEGDYRDWTSIPGLDDEEAEASDSGEDDEVVDSDFEEGTETDRTGTSL